MTIPGGSIQYATSGDGVGLECLVSGLRNPPLSLYWEKGNKVVTAKERPGVSLETEKLAGVSRIHLYIGQAVLEDIGNYTCVSDTASTGTVLLVVTQGLTLFFFSFSYYSLNFTLLYFLMRTLKLKILFYQFIYKA